MVVWVKGLVDRSMTAAAEIKGGGVNPKRLPA